MGTGVDAVGDFGVASSPRVSASRNRSVLQAGGDLLVAADVAVE
jgi:hypothetical protein